MNLSAYHKHSKSAHLERKEIVLCEVNNLKDIVISKKCPTIHICTVPIRHVVCVVTFQHTNLRLLDVGIR